MIQYDPSLEEDPRPKQYEDPDDEPWPDLHDHDGPKNYCPPGEQ